MTFFSRLLIAIALLLPVAAQAQFADQRQYVGSSGGTANAQTLAIPNVSGPPVGVPFRAMMSAANTTAATLNVNGTGAKNIMKPTAGGPAVLTGGELVAGQIAEFVYDGTNYQLLSNLNAAAAQVITTPGGYLTPCTQTTTPATGCTAGSLLPTGDVTAATVLYYTPVANGGQIPIWNGTQFIQTPFSQLTLTLGSSNLANTAYDVCVFNNAGVPTAVTSVAWSSSAMGSSARGTGAGTAELTTQNGMWVNAVAISGRNGANTYSIPAKQCTVVGSIFMDATNGQVSYLWSGGQSRKWSGYNFYNQQDLVIFQVDPTASWASPTPTGSPRPADNTTTNSLIVMSGLVSSKFDITFNVQIRQISTSGTGESTIHDNGICYNVTNAYSGLVDNSVLRGASAGALALQTGRMTYSALTITGKIGASKFTACERTSDNGGGATWFGGNNNYLLQAKWRG